MTFHRPKINSRNTVQEANLNEYHNKMNSYERAKTYTLIKYTNRFVIKMKIKMVRKKRCGLCMRSEF